MSDLNLEEQEKFATALITTALETLSGKDANSLSPGSFKDESQHLMAA